ncbi:PAS domain-containing protein [Anaerohalosphaera lusitana]|uniref:hybrid sensor histidine kinase/response regulator n=1 Tax=Anaerohalosphaera lusitana TaxID=1936003 RepID=UPI0011BAA100|nr:PAS domain-containing protein [Anaerohalosphaera lusitana]
MTEPLRSTRPENDPTAAAKDSRNSESQKNKLRVLLIEDETPHVYLIRRAFKNSPQSFELVTSRCLEDAKKLIAQHLFDVLVTDLMLPDGRGVDLLKDADITCKVPIVVMTSYGGEDIAVDALKAGAMDYVVKSNDAFEALPHITKNAVTSWRARETRRKSAEAVMKRESHLRMVLDATSGGVWDRDLVLDQVYYGSNWASMLGYKPEEIVPHTRFWHSLVHPDDRADVMRAMNDHLSGKCDKYSAEFRIRTKTGEYKWVLSRGKVVERDSDGKPTRIVGTHTDISERKLAEQEIQKINAELEQRVQERTRELSVTNEQLCKEMAERKMLEKEVLSISEREREWTGQELHDSLGQQLTGIAIMSKVLANKLKEKGIAESENADAISEMIKHSIEKTRAIAKGLHPIDIGNSGLCEAMRNLAANTASLFRVECSFSGDVEIEICDTAAAMNLYRIAQEAITNAIRHGHADNIDVTLDCNGENGNLRIVNDGAPFSINTEKSKGMGLRLMKHRAEMIDGKLEICQRRGGGAIVTCAFKLPQEWRKNNATEVEFTRSEDCEQ